MDKDFIEINGKEYRVEVNWNAMVAFLASVGKNNWEGLAAFSQVTPSDIAPLMAAAINEGERLEGRECHFTGADIGSMCGFDAIGKFVPIYIRQSSPKTSPDADKKKE